MSEKENPDLLSGKHDSSQTPEHARKPKFTVVHCVTESKTRVDASTKYGSSS